MNEPQAWLNGQYIPQSSLRIAATDAGFVQGTAVAEQLRTFNGRLFRFDDHLARLEHSLEVVGVEPGFSRTVLAGVGRHLASTNHRLLAAGDDLGLSIFVTPGAYPSYGPPESDGPTVALHTYPLPFRFWVEKYRRGQSLVTTDYRQVPPQCWPATLKCRSRMHYYLADRQAARTEPGARALLLDIQGFVAEASTANVILFNEQEGLVSPPSDQVLQGISLSEVVELSRQAGLPFFHRELRPEEVADADEVLLSSTPFCLLPVTRFNGRPIGQGVPGATFRKLLALWNERVGMDIAAQAERFAARV